MATMAAGIASGLGSGGSNQAVDPLQGNPTMEAYQQQVQQMQYTVKKYMEAYMKPVREQVIRLTKANSFLSKQVKEMQTSSIGLDIHKFSKENKGPLRETSVTMPKYVNNVDPGQTGGPRIFEKSYNLEKERQSIADIDKMISSTGNQPYG